MDTCLETHDIFTWKSTDILVFFHLFKLIKPIHKILNLLAKYKWPHDRETTTLLFLPLIQYHQTYAQNLEPVGHVTEVTADDEKAFSKTKYNQARGDTFFLNRA